LQRVEDRASKKSPGLLLARRDLSSTGASDSENPSSTICSGEEQAVLHCDYDRCSKKRHPVCDPGDGE
jgi:hypothetical protein